MRQVGIRELKAKLSESLKELPFEITRDGKVIARVIPPEDADEIKSTPLKPSRYSTGYGIPFSKERSVIRNK